MMIAITPDAMRRYSAALPAFRSRLLNQIALEPLGTIDEAMDLANFYVETSRAEAKAQADVKAGTKTIVTDEDIGAAFIRLRKLAERRGDTGVRQREFLHELHNLAETAIQAIR